MRRASHVVTHSTTSLVCVRLDTHHVWWFSSSPHYTNHIVFHLHFPSQYHYYNYFCWDWVVIIEGFFSSANAFFRKFQLSANFPPTMEEERRRRASRSPTSSLLPFPRHVERCFFRKRRGLYFFYCVTIDDDDDDDADATQSPIRRERPFEDLDIKHFIEEGRLL